ncbi:MAG: hypothetical protein ACK4F7_11230 [Inhella sp.]
MQQVGDAAIEVGQHEFLAQQRLLHVLARLSHQSQQARQLLLLPAMPGHDAVAAPEQVLAQRQVELAKPRRWAP